MLATLVWALWWVVGGAVAAATALALYVNANWGYWRARGVPCPPPEPFFGHARNVVLRRQSIAELTADLYARYASHRYVGFFFSRTPTLLLRDPELVRAVLTRDFVHFQDRGIVFDERKDPLSAHLFNLGGAKWRALRARLTPTFTSGKMRAMLALMDECAHQLTAHLDRTTCHGKQEAEVEVREAMARFTTDVIGSCAFGLRLNAVACADSEGSAFRRMGKRVFEPSLGNDLRRFLGLFVPALTRLFKVRAVSEETTEFFVRCVKETIAHRERHGERRNDFLQLLIQLRNGGSGGGKAGDEQRDSDEERDPLINSDFLEQRNGAAPPKQQQNGRVAHKTGAQHELELTDELLAAQAFVFFLAGFETSATTLSYALHELAQNPDVQRRLHAEVADALRSHGGRLPYDAVSGMRYLDMVVAETLRKYPPGHVLVRRCTRAYRLPGSGVTLEEGTRVTVPVYALHRDPRYYPQPERFDPERFTAQAKAARPPAVYLPFGDGPRLCIGMRFGLLQTKVGLAALLSRFEFQPCARTQHPLVIEPRTIVLSPRGGIWLRIVPRASD